MGTGRNLCIVPHGMKTTKEVVEGFTVFATNLTSDLFF